MANVNGIQRDRKKVQAKPYGTTEEQILRNNQAKLRGAGQWEKRVGSAAVAPARYISDEEKNFWEEFDRVLELFISKIDESTADAADKNDEVREGAPENLAVHNPKKEEFKVEETHIRGLVNRFIPWKTPEKTSKKLWKKTLNEKEGLRPEGKTAMHKIRDAGAKLNDPDKQEEGGDDKEIGRQDDQGQGQSTKV